MREQSKKLMLFRIVKFFIDIQASPSKTPD
jgi:hypothetical protein